MKNSEELRQQLRSINRKSYPAYKGLKGLYHFGNYIVLSQFYFYFFRCDFSFRIVIFIHIAADLNKVCLSWI